MNKLHNIRYGFMKFVWTYGQWFVLMFPHISYEGETWDDVPMEDLRCVFFEYLNNCEGGLLMILPTIAFGTFIAIHILLMIATIKDMIPDKDEIEFQRKMSETMKEVFK